MAKVFAPNKQYTGISANVVFKDGVGETSDPHLLKWFRDKGYTVEAAKRKPAQAEDPVEEVTELPESASKAVSALLAHGGTIDQLEEPAPEQPKKSQGGKSKNKQK